MAKRENPNGNPHSLDCAIVSLHIQVAVGPALSTVVQLFSDWLTPARINTDGNFFRGAPGRAVKLPYNGGGLLSINTRRVKKSKERNDGWGPIYV